MPGFDVLDPALDLLTDHFIEASAGTGKTFAIENIFTRLVEEKGLSPDEILVVTFTRAATLELKTRIRKKLAYLENERIFTIHSFCFHALKEYAFESGFSFDQIEESASLDILKQAAKDALRCTTVLHPKQIEKVLQAHQNEIDRLVNHLLAVAKNRLPIETGPSYETSNLEIQHLLASVDPALLLEDLLALAPLYGKLCDRQKNVKPEIQVGFKSFVEGDWVGTPLLLFNPDNRLKRGEEPQLHYPGLVEKCLPIIQRGSDPLILFATLAEQVRLKITQVIEEQELVFFEDLIQLMEKSVHNAAFASKVRGQYKAVLIDEFQDTDAVQWTIFSTLFLGHVPLYLVGDPKQAIYRFRQADIYTYLRAKKQMQSEPAILMRNFRSTPSLIKGLNALFGQAAFSLPQTAEKLAYQPVEPGEMKEDLDPPIMVMQVEEERELFELVIQEIGRFSPSQCAVLVKDRYQAARFEQACPFPTRLYKARSLRVNVLYELLQAVLNPRDRNAIELVLGGPLSGLRHEDFYLYHHLLEQKGILQLFDAVMKQAGPTLLQQQDGEVIYHEMQQLVEMIAEQQMPKESYLLYLQQLAIEDSDSERLKARLIKEQDAVNIMTVHASKGLEFDIVFPIGLAAPVVQRKNLVCYQGQYSFSAQAQQADQLESEAEQMRQIYVAFTRAKKRLYIPYIEKKTSPMQRFLDSVNESLPRVERSKVEVQTDSEESIQLVAPKQAVLSFPSCPIQSFSSLVTYEAVKKEVEVALPAGPEIGTLLHTIFEKISFAQPGDLSALVKGTPLEPFQTEVEAMVKRVLHLPLPFRLADVDPSKMNKEMPFLYSTDEGYMKGFIDLFFEHEGRYYFVDWKSNVIVDSAQKETERHHYDLQAKIYREALERYLGLFGEKLTAGFYIFLRSNDVITF